MVLRMEAALWKDRSTPKAVEMQHRHSIAAVIADFPTHAASLRAQQRSVALAFCDACVASNPRFDRDRFLRACGVEGEQ